MSRRAAIYIRTSSETQGGKSSTGEQEGDCRTLAQVKGLQIVHVYRDVEKYRVGSKLVEPSGRRSDRPALQPMLKAATRDAFDVILAWREDRLYRGIRAMLAVFGDRPRLQNRNPARERNLRFQDHSHFVYLHF